MLRRIKKPVLVQEQEAQSFFLVLHVAAAAKIGRFHIQDRECQGVQGPAVLLLRVLFWVGGSSCFVCTSLRTDMSQDCRAN